MALKQLGPSLRVMGPRIGAVAPVDAAEASRRRDASLAWRAWYKTARWQRLRWQVLVAACFICVRCRRVEGKTAQLVADHVVPHRGDATLFWDDGNLQCLCKTCHDSAKQAEERRGW